MSREGFPGGCNPADVLYKLAHSRGIKPPIFEMISEQGPPHARTFTWTCSFFEGKYHTMAAGRSKKEAKNAVAKALIDQVELADLPTKGPKGPSRFDKNRKRKSDDLETGEGDMENGAGKNKNKNKKKRGMGMNFQSDFQPFLMGFGINPLMMGGMPGMVPPSPRYKMNMRPMRMNKDDHMVMNKHREIYPGRDELQLILKLAETTERSLKRVSDKFCTVSVKAEGEDKMVEKKDEASREIMGVARIGELAKGLLLSGDRAVNLVVMGRHKPTAAFLSKLTAAVTEDLKNRPEAEMKGEGVLPNEQLEVHAFPEEGGFCVVYNKEGSEEPLAVNINLTSTKLRPKDQPKEDEEADKQPEKDENGIKIEKVKAEKVVEEPEEADPVDMLSRDKCLESLALLRRAKWFSTMAAPLESCVESVRIFKDLCRRDPVWRALGDWGVELLVEKAISTSNTMLNPSYAILRVLECVASGILAKDGPGIKDPCERETADVFAHLTAQQREDVTKLAQEGVRKVHYRKIYEILGMEKPPTFQERQAAKLARVAAEEAEKAEAAEEAVA